MSLQSSVHHWLTSAYSTANDAYEDVRDFVPGTTFTSIGPVPIRSSLDLLFGDDWQRAEVIEAYAVLFGGARQTASSDADAITRAVQPLIQESPMSQLIVPNCFQVTIQMAAGGHVIENVVGVQNGGGTAAGAAAAVLAAWKVASGPLAGLSSLVTMVQVRAVDIGSANGAIVVVPDTTAGGVTTGNSLATRGACGLIQWNGGTRSRSSRGRLYYGPIMETNIDTDGATLVGTTPTTFKNRLTAFQSSLSGASYPLVVLSRKLSQAFAVSSVTCESTIATQRRRIR
jgi:hypothetical protein